MKRREDDVNRRLYQITINNLKEKGIDIDLSTLDSIVKSKWQFIAYVIRFGQRESYRDKYLGNFGVKRWKPACQERRYLTSEENEYYLSIESPVDRINYLDQHYNEYQERIKLTENKLYFPVIMTDKKGKETEFNTLKEAAEFNELEPIHIYIASVKETPTKRGLKFRFKVSLTEIANNGYKDKKGTTNQSESRVL